MPTFGTTDVIQDVNGNALGGLLIKIYGTKSDASGQTNLVGTAVTNVHGQWPVTVSGYDMVWVRDPSGNVWPVSSDTVAGDHASRLAALEGATSTYQPVSTFDATQAGNINTNGSQTDAALKAKYAALPASPAAYNLYYRDGSNNPGWTTSQASVARALGWIVATDPAYGVVMDWAGGTTGTDNTTALQAAINAGPIVWLPSGYARFSGNLALGQHTQLMGAGYSAFAQENFGDPLWTSATGYTRYKGTVLYCSATSGAAITGDNATAGRWRLQGFMLVGPGSGTSTGISLCQTPSFNIRPNVRDVGVFNFSTGWAIGGTNEGEFNSMVAYSCSTGFSFGPNFNANTVINLECQRSTVDGVTVDGYANTFVGGIVQNASGTTGLHVKVSSVGNTFSRWYCENITASDSVLIDNANEFSGKFAGNVSQMRLTAGGCVLSNVYAPSTTLVLAAGIAKNVLIECAFGAYTRNGADIIDVSSRLSGTSAPTVGIGNDTPWQFERTDAETTLRLKDTVNAHYIADFYPAATDATALAWFHGCIATGAAVTGSRPSAGNFTASSQWYDTTYKKPIWSDGTLWRDARGYATPIAVKTANYTHVDGDEIVVYNGASLTATLPDPTTVIAGKRWGVKNVNASALTVVSAGTSKTLDGAASQSLAQWAKAEFVSDGTQWLTV